MSANLNNLVKAVSLVVLLFSNTVYATPINGTGLITPDVIFGSGNANGSWTGVNVNGVEVALRGKLRYDEFGNPQNIFNYDGDRTYTFDPVFSSIPAGRSVFNFEYAVNVDSTGTSGAVLSDFTYLFEFDTDPTVATSFLGGDIVNQVFTDNAMGTNATGNGGGTVAADPVEYATLISSTNVAQNSQNRGFGFSGMIDPAASGIFTYQLSVLLNGTLLASTSIDVVVEQTAIPAPAITPLFLLALLLLGVKYRQRNRQRG
ncbi:PEP-CTERM sorting domain-containing protein [Thalassotalea euphylliae]|uniref:PEP-CTERM sorting domain-containing protein n=1 Tax=Thalassotalea euphylliae TaxID=1655234 RepID=A0A3E0TQA8_9GAMM|nr:PEP-CTERM sorting domain-containing protein [Thalassotalea euphylliae]REL26232.1 PEP-CTERM sorting domain-containing protein [Thalassotalea euphylliae]